LHRGEVDLVICPSEYAITGVPTELIYEEEYVIAGDGEHPLFREAFAFDDLFDYGFVAVSVGSERSATVGERHFDLLGRARRIEITAPSFAAIPWMLVGTQRLALMHRRLAKLAAERFGLAFASLPGDFPPLRQLMHFHETRANDDGLAWLRARLRHTANAQD
jgi:DNA-binding transcriptional LysR family regulator